MNYAVRVVLSVAVVFIAGWVKVFLLPVSAIGSAGYAGQQLANSDQAAVGAVLGMRFYAALPGLVIVATLLLLLLLWWAPLRRAVAFVKKDLAGALLLAAATSLLGASPAHAFWSTTNTTEAYGILPNHTAFWVPGMGDTKDAQAHTESEQFLRENKVPGKFFIIPHAKLSGSVYIGWDYYIPTGRLIVVDRAPFFHEWTKKGRGTDAGTDQSFPCHSRDNVQVSAEMSLASSVTEPDAAKFLFYFGVNQPAGDPSKPEVIFTSVYEGRTLAQVMSGWGRGEIQSRVCRHINAYTIEQLGLHGNEILDAIQAEAKQFFSGFGVTIEYIGWAGGFEYPPEVQAAINTRFAAEHITPVIATLETKARIDAISGWDRHLPTSVTLFGGLSDLVSSFITRPKP